MRILFYLTVSQLILVQLNYSNKLKTLVCLNIVFRINTINASHMITKEY